RPSRRGRPGGAHSPRSANRSRPRPHHSPQGRHLQPSVLRFSRIPPFHHAAHVHLLRHRAHPGHGGNLWRHLVFRLLLDKLTLALISSLPGSLTTFMTCNPITHAF